MSTNKDNNIYQANELIPGGTYDFVLDGTGVDVVIIDPGIEPIIPEFTRCLRSRRVKEVNWSHDIWCQLYSQNANHYRDRDGHGNRMWLAIRWKNIWLGPRMQTSSCNEIGRTRR